jgi:hypothetical protein
MGTALLIGITAMLGGLALGLGVFVLCTPPARPAAKRSHIPPGSLLERKGYGEPHGLQPRP